MPSENKSAPPSPSVRITNSCDRSSSFSLLSTVNNTRVPSGEIVRVSMFVPFVSCESSTALGRSGPSSVSFVPIVSTTEELAYPTRARRRFARQIDELAKKGKVAVLGTGVNPGFVMDALPIMLTGVCESVQKVHVDRIQDARIRRLPFQQKIGSGLTPAAFQARVSKHLQRVVSTLPKQQRDVLLLHVNEGLTYKQIADRLGITYRIVLQDLTRAYGALRMQLKGDDL